MTDDYDQAEDFIEAPRASETGAPPAESLPDQQDLIDELDELIERVKRAHPEYSPPPFSPASLVDLIRDNLDKFSPAAVTGLLGRLRSTINDPFRAGSRE